MLKKKNLFTSDEMTRSDRCLHTPDSFARQNLLYVQEVGTLQSIQPHRCVREKLDSFLLLFVTEGRGSLEIAGRHVEVKAGDCAFIDCMEHYEHISDEEDAWRLAWVHFNGQSARAFFELFSKYNGGESVFRVPRVSDFEEIIVQLRGRQGEKNLLSEISSGALLLQLLQGVLAAVSASSAPESESDKHAAEEIRAFINEQYVEENVFELLAEAFGRDVRQLDGIFGRAYHITLKEYVGSRRYNAAKELLRFSVKEAGEVARESGIGDLETMQRQFRENEGMSAEEYRQKWAGWVRN